MNPDMTYWFKKGDSPGKIRRLRINEYSSKVNQPACIGRDARFDLLAYQIMTDEEILMSEKRESNEEAIYDFVRRDQKYNRWVKEPHPDDHMRRARAAA
jgi:hypothetical protein